MMLDIPYIGMLVPDDMLAANVELALKQLKGRYDSYMKYEAYYVGKHPLNFASEVYEDRFARMVSQYTENYCGAVVDSVVDRLIVTGFEQEGEDEGDEVSEAAITLWKQNRMDENSLLTHLEAVKAGDAYVIVWPDAIDSTFIRIWPQDAYCMCIHRDDETDEIDWAAKYWVDETTGKGRLTMYYPEVIIKLVTRNKPQDRPLKYVGFVELERITNPYNKVPVFHFRNNGRIGGRGRSELDDVTAVQDALNKSVCDMLVAQEFVGFPQRYAVGVNVRIDPLTGKPDPKAWKPGYDHVWTVANKDASFGQFEAANLVQLLQEQNRFKEAIADVSGTPTHYLKMTGENWPSGESLKTAEARFVSKIRKKQVVFGNVWEDAMTFALEISGYTLTSRISTIWQNPSPRSEMDAVNVSLGKKNLGVPLSQLQRELGYTEEEVDKMATEKESETEKSIERQQRLFDSGSLPVAEE